MDAAPTSLWADPQLATSSKLRAPGDGWILERKLDGVRIIAARSNGQVRLLSRNRNDVTASYPDIATALDHQVGGSDFVIDGEVVAFTGDEVGGRNDFGRLQKRIHLSDERTIARTGVPVWFYAFDLLRFGGHDTRGLNQLQRKQLLLELDAWHDALVYVDHQDADGTTSQFESACDAGWEGLIAKKAGAPYRFGRSPSWLKLKCSREQELVVGGWLPPGGSRLHLGALLVGYYDSGELIYAGSVGTGFSRTVLAYLRGRLDVLAADHCPFSRTPVERGARWVRPELVAQVAFADWTAAGRLRHPSFKGLRTDRDARDVVREA